MLSNRSNLSVASQKCQVRQMRTLNSRLSLNRETDGNNVSRQPWSYPRFPIDPITALRSKDKPNKFIVPVAY